MLRTSYLFTINRCDRSCQHCLQGAPSSYSNFPLELLERLLIETLPFRARFFGLTGGEACLHPDFPRTVETIARFGYSWSVVSNGQHTDLYLPLMEKTRERFRKASLSIDSANPAVHDEIRKRKGAFDRVTAAARTYVEKGFPVWIKTSLNQRSRREVDDLVKLAEGLGADGIRFGGTIPNQWNGDLLLTERESLELFQQIQSLRSSSRIEIGSGSSLYTSGGVFFCGLLSLYALAVNQDGNLIFCCDTRHEGSTFGSLREKPLSILIQEWLKTSAGLQAHRAERIARGEMGSGSDTCAYCAKYLEMERSVSTQ